MEIFVEENFWHSLKQLLQQRRVVVDRPRGSQHPRYPDAVYPLNYGYLDGTTSNDGAGLDVWLGSGRNRELSGVLLTSDLSKRDAEIKIMLGCTPRDIEQILEFMRSENTGCLVIMRDLDEYEKQ